MRISDWSSDVCSSDLVTPLMIDDTLYFCTPYNRIIALDAASGAERWKYDPHTRLKNIYSKVCRGVAYWRDARAASGAACATRIYEATLDDRLIAVDADTGKPCEDFGANGAVNLLQRSEEHTSELQSLMRISYAVFCLNK